jgi:peptidoglycan/xylan/chitin deacetylase (PgdA/CDA1 family)
MNNKFYTQLWDQATVRPLNMTAKTRFFFRSAALSSLSALSRPAENNFLRCLYCHYVFDNQVNRFEEIIVNLKKFGQFIDTESCVKMLNGKEKVDGKYFHLSFDDGFRNNYTNALPILKKHKVPSIFFIPSSMVNQDYEKTKKYCLDIIRYNVVIETLKWDDIREMVDLGFDIGSHTKTHAKFSDISENVTILNEEIVGSKEEIEIHLGTKCKYVSWPYGGINHADETSLEVVKKAGYEACFGAFRGAILPGSTDRYRIPRHHFEVQWPISHINYFANGGRESLV